MYKICDKVIPFRMETMKNRQGELTTVGYSLVEFKIQKGIFQGHVLLPLLFVTMILLIHTLEKFS